MTAAGPGPVGGGWSGEPLRQWWRRQRLASAITADSPEAAELAAIGHGTCLAFPQGVLHGLSLIALGAGCLINEYVTLSAGPLAGPQAPGPAERADQSPVIELGDRVLLGRRSEIVAMQRVAIGADTAVAPNVYITDHNHTRADPDEPILSQPLAIRPVTIGAGSTIGAGAVILPGAHLGAHTQVGAGAIVTAGAWPPHTLLVGNPARPAAS